MELILLTGAVQPTAEVLPALGLLPHQVSVLPQDAAALVEGGYRIERIVPVDQFIYSAHLEVVAVFRRSAAKARKRRPLLA